MTQPTGQASFTIKSVWSTQDGTRMAYCDNGRGGLVTVSMPHMVSVGQTVRLIPDGRGWRYAEEGRS